MGKLTQDEKDAIRDTAVAQWWKDWFKADYSWEGLTKFPWQGWKVVESKTAYQKYLEEHGLPAGCPNETCQVVPMEFDGLSKRTKTRPATLQDYWRDQEGNLEKKGGSKEYTIAHLPVEFESGKPSWKADQNSKNWQTLAKIIKGRVERGAKTLTETKQGSESIINCEKRSYLRGCILQTIAAQITPFAPQDETLKYNRDLHLNLFQANISGHQSFEGAVFGSAVNFEQTKFSGFGISFYRAHFVGEGANFIGACFVCVMGPDFRAAKFSGSYANFKDAKIITGTASFSGVEFTTKSVNFQNVKFPESGTFFRHAIFLGTNVYFMNAAFVGPIVDFTSAQFSGEKVDFSYAKFGCDESVFDQVKIECSSCCFKHSEFSKGKTSFSKAQFDCNDINFYNVTFSGGYCSFDNVVFKADHVDFNKTEFSGGNASFRKADFSTSNVHFSEVNFSGGSASFRNTQLGKKIIFEDTNFGKKAIFQNAVFPNPKGTKSAFRGTQFLGPADFSRTSYLYAGRISSSDDHLHFPFNAFDHANFKDQLILTQRGDEEAQIEFDRALNSVAALCKNGISIDETELQYVALEAGCTTLKRAMEHISDKNRAQRYFKFELLARQRRPSTSWLIKKFTDLYGWSADYGGSVWLPLKRLLQTSVFFALLYGLNASLIDVNPDTVSGCFWGPLEFSVTHIFRPLFIWSTSTPSADISWVGKYREQLSGGGWFAIKLLATIQSFLSITLLFLFGLATKRKFQIS